MFLPSSIRSTKLASSLSITQQQVLELLSAALYNRLPQTVLFELSTNWEAITRLAKEQSILALVVERLLMLPKELQPERSLRIKQALSIELITQHYHRQLREQQELYDIYEQEALFPILLKGITLSALYPNPPLRSLGDLDLFLPKPGDYDKANHWAKSQGYRLIGDSIYEQAYLRNKLMVENHKLLTYFGIPRYDKTLEEIIRQIDQDDTWTYTYIAGKRYRTLPLELNAVYIFMHILHHFSYLGIGLRHISDWLLLLKEQGERMDIIQFNHYAQQFDLLRPMQLFALMAVQHLNVSADIFPFVLPSDKESKDLALLIIQDTFRGGNFGFEHFSGRKFRNIWSRRWFMFCRTTLRSFKVAPIAPQHIRLIPIIALLTRLKLLFRLH